MKHASFLPTSLCLLATLCFVQDKAFSDEPQLDNHPNHLSGKQTEAIQLRGDAKGIRFDGIGMVNGGGATSVLLKDYPEPQRSQILDLVFKPKFGASVSSVFVEIPGDGNSTQGSMPSHMHTRDDLNYSRGYTWWILREAQKRNPNLTLDGTAWSAPGWIGNGKFWSQDTADYYVKWLEGLRDVYGLEFTAIGCRNEKRFDYGFVKKFRATLDANGFDEVKIHAFDNWPNWKFDFVKEMQKDKELRDAIDIIGGHVMYAKPNAHASQEVQQMAKEMGKPIWNTEDHVYLKGFDCEIGLVECFNDSFILSGATKIINWYDIAGIYSMEPYSEDPATILAHSPWSGHYQVRKALWGYAHYGQFTAVGWEYLKEGCQQLPAGGSVVTMKSPGNDYSIIIETKDATGPQTLSFKVSNGLSDQPLCVWRSNEQEQFVEQESISPVNGAFTLTLDPHSIYSLSTTRGQQKGSFDNIPSQASFPFPYHENYEKYSSLKASGYLARYQADIEEVFELVERPDGKGNCLQQVIPRWPISWAPSWQPYTIIGDDAWDDYEVSVDIQLNPNDTAAVMGRVNDVGTGYGCIPKGYFLQLADNGTCSLYVVRGKKNKRKLVGDAEQQARIRRENDASAGGEKLLATVELPGIKPGDWHNLTLRFEGEKITVLVDGKPVLKATDSLYNTGMAGLMARSKGKRQLSTPYYDNLVIKSVGPETPGPTKAPVGLMPLYGE